MNRSTIKREVDFQIISDWIEPGSRVLDLGCGRGILLEHLIKAKDVYGIGVDPDLEKIQGCVKRGVSAYQGDALESMHVYPEQFFDWVIISRTLHELQHAAEVLSEAARVGRLLAVGFTNFAYWKNRLHMAATGHRIENEVYPDPWFQSAPTNPVSINEFEQYCSNKGLKVQDHVYLAGNWRSHCRFWPNLLAGYVVYKVGRSEGVCRT